MPSSVVGSTSASLLEQARQQDRDAWIRVVRLYGPLVYGWCRRAKLTDAELDDIFQEVFATAAAKLSTFRKASPGDTFRGWLRVVAMNKVRDHFRAKVNVPHTFAKQDAGEWLDKNRGTEVSEVDVAPPDESSELYRRALALMEDAFEPRTWRAFWRTVVDGQSTTDVADELQMSKAGVRQAKSRVLRRLRSEFHDLLP